MARVCHITILGWIASRHDERGAVASPPVSSRVTPNDERPPRRPYLDAREVQVRPRRLPVRRRGRLDRSGRRGRGRLARRRRDEGRHRRRRAPRRHRRHRTRRRIHRRTRRRIRRRRAILLRRPLARAAAAAAGRAERQRRTRRRGGRGRRRMGRGRTCPRDDECFGDSRSVVRAATPHDAPLARIARRDRACSNGIERSRCSPAADRCDAR